IFMGQSELLDNYDVYSVGSVLKSVDEIPKENFASYKIAVGTEIFKVKKDNINEDFSPYIFIKDTDNNGYKIGVKYINSN
ncbi:hypothetical protein KWK45_018425, partial [Clostridioides difficile]|nr:hypothetical protein [Clostridioides difficile]